MKKLVILSMIVSACTALTAAQAYADNHRVEDALKVRPDLSDFYQALVKTGVANELRPDVSYTVFAPTNAAWENSKPIAPYCATDEQCRAISAQIVRNHIVPEKVFVEDASDQHGGMYTIGHRFINVGSPTRNNYAVDGNGIIDGHSMGSLMLYRINGVIAKPRDFAMADQMYVEPERESVTTSERTIHDPACGPAGCPD